MDVPPSGTRSVLVISVIVVVVVMVVVVVVVVVSTEDEVVESEGSDEELEDWKVDDGTVEESWIVGVVISVVWPTPEPAVPWAVVDVVSWKRARIIGVSFSRFGVVWGTLVASLVLISVAGIGLDISGGDWLVVTPVSSVELTSWGAVVVIGGVVASRVSLSAVALVTGANCVVVDIVWLVSTFSTPFTIDSTPGAVVVCSVFVSRDVDGVVVIVFTEGSVVSGATVVTSD